MPDLVQPVAEALQFFALNLQTARLQPEILTGVGNLPRWNLFPNGPIYGINFTVLDVLPQLGHTAGGDPYYTLPLMTLQAIGTTRTGQFMTVWRRELHTLDELVVENNLLLSSIAYRVLVGCSFTFSYLTL